MKFGRILGIIGGVLILVGIFLPWSITKGSLVPGGEAVITGLNLFGYMVMIFGIIGLILVALGKRGTSIGALIMGIIAFVLTLLVLGVLSLIAGSYLGVVTQETGIGIYLCIIGSAIAFVDAGKAKMAPPPMAPSVPPPA
jgi:hypothetical protein